MLAYYTCEVLIWNKRRNSIPFGFSLSVFFSRCNINNCLRVVNGYIPFEMQNVVFLFSFSTP